MPWLVTEWLFPSCMASLMLTTLPCLEAGGAHLKQLCCSTAGLMPPWAESEAVCLTVRQELSSEGSEHQDKACLVLL